MMHDNYSQVVNESKSMLAECFPNEKYGIVLEMFKEPVCGIALKFVSGKHSLLARYVCYHADFPILFRTLFFN